MDSVQGSWKCRANVVGTGIGRLTAAIALRRAGHEVHLYPSAETENAPDEVVHICPNANSVLAQLGVELETSGGCRLEQIAYYGANGGSLGAIDVKSDARRWQKPWLVTTRSKLLRHLEGISQSKDAVGTPVQIHRDSATVSPNKNETRLEDGTTIPSDVLVCPTIRSQQFVSILAQARLKNDTNTSIEASVFAFKDKAGILSVCQDTASLSMAGDSLQPGNVMDALPQLKNASPAILDAITKAVQDHAIVRAATSSSRPASSRAFTVSTENTFYPAPSIIDVSMAVEDGASIGVFLSGLVGQEDIPARLQLYIETRGKRVEKLQQLSEKAYEKLQNGILDTGDLDYAFGHDEIHHATQVLRQYVWDKTSRISWRQPVGFGPMTSPRQHVRGWTCANPRPERLADATSLTASIRFRTSATLLRNMFPSDAYRFAHNDSVAEASYIFQAIENLAWLGGGGYNLVLFQIHGIRHHSKATNTTRDGAYVAVVLEDLTDPILSGREDLGWPKLYSEIAATDDVRSGGRFSVKMSWRGTEWLALHWDGLRPYSGDSATPASPPSAPEHVFVHKYIPATVETPTRKDADADYDVLMPPPSPHAKPVAWMNVSTDASIHVPAPSEASLPTLWHIASRLAELPVFEIVDAKIGSKQGQDDFIGATRV